MVHKSTCKSQFLSDVLRLSNQATSSCLLASMSHSGPTLQCSLWPVSLPSLMSLRTLPPVHPRYHCFHPSPVTSFLGRQPREGSLPIPPPPFLELSTSLLPCIPTTMAFGSSPSFLAWYTRCFPSQAPLTCSQLFRFYPWLLPTCRHPLSCFSTHALQPISTLVSTTRLSHLRLGLPGMLLP